jgi:hypothetical protein
MQSSCPGQLEPFLPRHLFEGVTARDLSCLEVVHHLGAVYDGVIFSGRAGRD